MENTKKNKKVNVSQNDKKIKKALKEFEKITQELQPFIKKETYCIETTNGKWTISSLIR